MNSGSSQLLYFCDFDILVSFLGFSHTRHIAFLQFQLYVIFNMSCKLLLLIIIITVIIIMVIINNFIISVIVFINTLASSSFTIFVIHSSIFVLLSLLS